jgi:hypothetical protein
MVANRGRAEPAHEQTGLPMRFHTRMSRPASWTCGRPG